MVSAESHGKRCLHDHNILEGHLLLCTVSQFTVLCYIRQ